jgi:hypothetical protein
MSTGLISSAGRGVVCAVIGALVLATPTSPIMAAPAAKSATVASSGATDFSAARRHRHYYRGSNAAGAAFAGLAFGMVAGAIAAQQRRDYYENYGYYYGPGYYHGPVYQPYYYGPRYYGPRTYYYPY